MLKVKLRKQLKQTVDMLRFRNTRLSEQQILKDEESELAIANLEEQNNLLKDNILAMIEEKNNSEHNLVENSEMTCIWQESKNVSQNRKPRLRCKYCKCFGHDVHACNKVKKKHSVRTNSEGPKNLWVPKTKPFDETGMSHINKEKAVVLG